MQEARLELRLRVRHSRLLTLCTTLLEDRDFCMPPAGGATAGALRPNSVDRNECDSDGEAGEGGDVGVDATDANCKSLYVRIHPSSV